VRICRLQDAPTRSTPRSVACRPRAPRETTSRGSIALPSLEIGQRASRGGRGTKESQSASGSRVAGLWNQRSSAWSSPPPPGHASSSSKRPGQP
jgi:hypothetical protein